MSTLPLPELPRAVPLDDALAARPPWPKPVVPGSKIFSIGLDCGALHDPSAIVVARAEVRLLKEADWLSNQQPEYETIFRILGCERLPLRTSYPAVGQRVCTLARRLRDREPECYLVCLVDATGVGRPVVDLLRDHVVPECMISAVTLTGGHVWQEGLFYRSEARVSKLQLVSRLQALLQAGRILMPRDEQMAAMVQELRDFSLKTKPSGHVESGAFETGQHDDLAVALALATACSYDAPRIGPGIDEYGSPAL